MKSRGRAIEKEVGRVTQYDAIRSMADVQLSGRLQVGNRIRVKGKRSDWRQLVTSMLERGKPITKARAGQLISLEIIKRAYKDDKVLVIREITGPHGEPRPPKSPETPEPSRPGPSKPRRPKPKRPRPGLPKPKRPEWEPEPPELELPEPEPSDNDDDEEPDLPDLDDFEIDSEEKEKEGGEGG